MVVSCVVEDKIGAFVESVRASNKFDLFGLSEDDSKFVLQDTAKSDGTYGKYVEVSVQEVVNKPLVDIFNVLENERNPIICEGVTRIVGYYSRMNNWNKSKVGELRDRHSVNYALAGNAPQFDENRLAYVNSL
jgi:hypothetical protein|tara:strand:- start:1439 stop:1837 length:399 start_codon:yes stop_codon:yes gene_type:complete